MFFSGIEIGDRPESHRGIMGTNQQPWLPIEAIDFLEKNLKKNHIGFEFGSGSSTFWFSKLTRKIISLESSKDWNSMIHRKCLENSIENINLNLVECEMLPIWDNDIEIGGNYDLYSSKILQFNHNFDYILVDGVSRSLCIENSIQKINIGGYLIIDNAERPAYFQAMDMIPKEWEVYEFRNPVDLTKIFKRIN